MIAFFVVFLVLIVVQSLKTDDFKVFAGYEKVVVVCDEKYLDLDDNPIISGNDFYHCISGEKASHFFKNIKSYKYKGLSFYFDKSYSIEDFNKLFNNTLMASAIKGEYTIYYGYYEDFKDFRMIDGKRINVQLADVEDNWIVGMPLILTGF